MALDRSNRYPGRFENPTTTSPQGAFKNRTSPTAQDGSYFEADWANDWDGFFARILNVAGVTPNGTVDNGSSSQYYDALKSLFLQRANPFGDIKSDGTVQTALANLGFGGRLLEANGYFELPGGLLLQWGKGQINATSTIVQFKKPFNVTPFIVLPHKIADNGRYVTSVNYTLTGFSLYGWNGDGTVSNIDNYVYFALGM